MHAGEGSCPHFLCQWPRNTPLFLNYMYQPEICQELAHHSKPSPVYVSLEGRRRHRHQCWTTASCAVVSTGVRIACDTVCALVLASRERLPLVAIVRTVATLQINSLPLKVWKDRHRDQCISLQHLLEPPKGRYYELEAARRWTDSWEVGWTQRKFHFHFLLLSPIQIVVHTIHWLINLKYPPQKNPTNKLGLS